MVLAFWLVPAFENEGRNIFSLWEIEMNIVCYFHLHYILYIK